MEPHRAILFPQFFWSGIACLTSPHEEEFAEAVWLLKKFLVAIDLDDSTVRGILLSSIPLKWKGEFSGLQHLLVNGIPTACESSCLEVIDLFLDIEDERLIEIDPIKRVLYSVISYIPRLLHVYIYSNFQNVENKDDVVETSRCKSVAARLSNLCKRLDFPDLAHILLSVSKGRFKDTSTLAGYFAISIRQSFFSSFKKEALKLIVSFTASPLDFYKSAGLMLLKPNIANVDTSIYDIIEPLFYLSGTIFATKSIEILESTLKGSNLRFSAHDLLNSSSNEKRGRNVQKIIKDLQREERSRVYNLRGWRNEGRARETRGNMQSVAEMCFADPQTPRVRSPLLPPFKVVYQTRYVEESLVGRFAKMNSVDALDELDLLLSAKIKTSSGSLEDVIDSLNICIKEVKKSRGLELSDDSDLSSLIIESSGIDPDDSRVAAEFIKLFPASFEMTMKFFQDCVDDLKTHLSSTTIVDVYNCMQSILQDSLTSYAEKCLATDIERYFYYHTHSEKFDGFLRQVVESCIMDVNDKVSSVLLRRDEFLDNMSKTHAVVYCCAVINMHMASLEMQGGLELIMDVNEV